MDKIYKVTVYNNNGSSVYYTHWVNVTDNYLRGNEPMIRFETIKGKIVNLPGSVIIEQEELNEEQRREVS